MNCDSKWLTRISCTGLRGAGSSFIMVLDTSLIIITAASISISCTSSGEADRVDSGLVQTTQELRVERTDEGDVKIAFEHLLTDAEGELIGCGEGRTQVALSVRAIGENRFIRVGDADIELRCVDSAESDVAIVVDNSGSLEDDVEQVRQTADILAKSIIDAGGRASLIRVSTNAGILIKLSDDLEQVRGQYEKLTASNGWTALYDGLRVANETLEGDRRFADNANDALIDFCGNAKKVAIVALTDGGDNNSSDEKLRTDKYPGDGIKTSLEDVMNLEVGGITTPIYTVGVGEKADHKALIALAEGTGGRHLLRDNFEGAQNAFSLIGDYLNASHRICADLTTLPLCGNVEVKVDTKWSDGRRSSSSVQTHTLNIPCAERESGRVATALLTFSDPGISNELAADMTTKMVDWVSPVDEPTILLVLDDNNHRENHGDTEYIQQILQLNGYEVQFLNEPSAGLSANDVAGYDVVWFSNPGYPMDDLLSFETLRGFEGGVVIQGDDLTWAWGRSFSLAPLVRLDHINNGTSRCGVRIDNNRGSKYRVTITGEEGPFADLDGTSFLYGNDIDLSTPSADAQIIGGTALPDGMDPEECTPQPVFSFYSP